jgi:hypothetical protein
MTKSSKDERVERRRRARIFKETFAIVASAIGERRYSRSLRNGRNVSAPTRRTSCARSSAPQSTVLIFTMHCLRWQQAKTAMSSVTTAWAGGSKGTKAKSLAVSVSYAPELKTVSALEANPCLIAKRT